MMQQTLLKQFGNVREMWRQNAMLRLLVFVSVPILLLGFSLGGLRIMMLLIGYLQLVLRAAVPGEPVETNPLQRTAALAGGLSRMLFFTGMMTHAALPMLLIAAAQAAGLFILEYGARTGTEVSLLPILASSGFLVLGLIFSVRFPAVWITLSGTLTLTLVYLLAHARQNWNQLRMRFHLT